MPTKQNDAVASPTKEQREQIEAILKQIADGIQAMYDMVPDGFDWSEYSDPGDAHDFLTDPDAEVGRLWAVYAWLDYGEEMDERDSQREALGPDHFTGFDGVQVSS